MLVAGIDGGQSATRAAIGDDTRILGRAVGPPADLVGQPRDSKRQLSVLESTLASAVESAGLPADSRLDAVVAGLTGYDAPAAGGEGRSPRPLVSSAMFSFADSVVVHDSIVAHAGALGGRAGIVVLAGTGSVAAGNASNDEATFVRAGGWGYFFGDRGGALAIARESIASAMRDADRGKPSPLGRAALRFFGASDLREIQHAFAHGELTRLRLAAFAAEVMTLAEAGEVREAARIRAAAADALADLAAAVHRRLPVAEVRMVSYAGGVFRDEGMRRLFRSTAGALAGSRAARGSGPVTILEPIGDPIDGALMLARRRARDRPRDATT